MNKTVSIIISLGLFIALGIIFMDGPESTQGAKIKNGVQYINILASGGYSPELITAKSGIPTKLIKRTKGLCGCGPSLVSRCMGFQKFFPQTGKTEIDLESDRGDN